MPSAKDEDGLLQHSSPAAREPNVETICFHDDGFVPNHPRWPLILYRQAVDLSEGSDPATLIESLFAKNGWGRSWRNGIYPYTHYHSMVHEVLGIARWSVEVQFGGDHGRAVTLNAGDVAILPAGTGHRRLSASADYLVFGAYPPEGQYDECRSEDVYARAVRNIAVVPRPKTDPVSGTRGALVVEWSA